MIPSVVPSDGDDATLVLPSDRTRILAGSPPSPVAPIQEPQVGTAIGRYTLLDRLGAGGMGVVYAAHDPRLDRRVALKVLRPDPSIDGPLQSQGRARLQREAQAMARLSHPHVVEVYDVGVASGHLYIAMALVDGVTLRTWLQSLRQWSEVLEVFLQSGRGLAAAHAVGLVHRDFKPDNVLVDRAGRARVTDFGLALPQMHGPARSAPAPHESAPGLETLSSDRLMSPVTAVGMVMGTPAYMAPEQHLGRDVEASADQYAFCAALYDGLYGVRPFRGDTIHELMESKLEVRLRNPARGHDVPPRVARAITRGLAAKPRDRFESMDALLRALAPDVRRRRWWAGALGVGVLLSGMVAVETGERSPCDRIADRLGGVWDDERKAEVRTALLATRATYAQDTWVRVEQQLDSYTSGWVQAHGQQCETQAGSPVAMGPSFDLQWACYERARRRVGAVVEVLTEVDVDALPQAVPLVLDLPRLGHCARLDALTDDAPQPDAAVARRVVELEGRLARVDALLEAGRYAEGTRLSANVRAEADRLGHDPTILRSYHLHAKALELDGALEHAQILLTDGIYRAQAAGNDEIVVRMAAALAHLVGHRLLRFDEGRTWVRHGEAALARVDDDGRLEAELRSAQGNLLVSANEPETAVLHLQRAIELRTVVDGEESLAAARARNNLGMALYAQGRHEDAIVEYRRVLKIRQALLGAEHPEIAITEANLANALFELGRHDEALAHRKRVYSVMHGSLGPSHLHTGEALHSLGNSSVALLRLDEASDYFRRAIAVRSRALGAESADVASSRVNLGIVLSEQGHYDEALIELRRAEDIMARTVGQEHVWTAGVLGAVANLQHDRGRYEQARVQWLRALELRRRLHGPDHPAVAFVIRGLGISLLELGRADEAVRELEHALAIQQRGNTAPDNLAHTQMVLAQALVQSGGSRPRAMELARLARAGLLTRPERTRDEVQGLDRWLAEL